MCSHRDYPSHFMVSVASQSPLKIVQGHVCGTGEIPVRQGTGGNGAGSTIGKGRRRPVGGPVLLTWPESQRWRL